MTFMSSTATISDEERLALLDETDPEQPPRDYIGTETLDSAIGLAKTIGKQFFNPENENTQKLGRGLKATGQALGESWMETREFGEWYDVKQNLDVVGKPVAGFARDKLNLDPRIAGAVALAAEMVATAGTAKVGQLAKARVSGTFRGLTEGLGGTGMASAAVGVRPLPNIVNKVKVAQIFRANDQFVSEIAEKTTRMTKLINKTADNRGWTNLSKYKGKDNLITSPSGEKFRYMWKDGRYSWRSMTSEAKRALTRLTGESADLTTITNQFKKNFNPKQAKEAAQIYVATQQTVKKKIDAAIAKFNTGKVKTDPSRLSLEHITDVKFFDRIKKDIPSFPGKGANELQNLTILDLPTNMRTGALNKKMDHWMSVIDSVKTGKGFADYNKSILNFIYEDVGGMVTDFTPKDWDNFIHQMVTRQGDTAYDILIEMARNQN